MLRVLFVTVAIALLSVASADAREVRVPESGFPAAVLELPDDWTVEMMQGGTANIQPPGRKAGVMAQVVEASLPPGTFDQAEIVMSMNGVPAKGQAITVSGLRAFKFVATQTQQGTTGTMTTVEVMIDNSHLAIVSTMTTDQTPAEYKTQAGSIIESMKIVTGP